MGKKCKPRVIPEQDGRIIGTICMCQLTMVLSGVALVYLSVAVYAPSHKTFHSGIDPDPVMCETVKTEMPNNCTWASCGEWCLTKTSGFCPQILVVSRRNGSLLQLEGCRRSRYVECKFGATLAEMIHFGAILPIDYRMMNSEPMTKWNCIKDECMNLDGVYNCSIGQCTKYSDVWNCSPKGGDKNLTEKEFQKLSGLFECHSKHKRTFCTEVKLKKSLDCERICPNIITNGFNVFIQRGDGILAADCYRALASDPSVPGPEPAPFWVPSDGHLMAACYTFDYNKTAETIVATDCVNGTAIPPHLYSNPIMNFSKFRQLWETAMEENLEDQSRTNRIPGKGVYLPPSNSLAFHSNYSKLLINTKACVNTLRGECRQFLEDYGFDGRNFSARSRFPCYFNRNNSKIVVARFDLEETWRELMVAALVPAILFAISLTTLCIITRSVKVGDDAKLRCLMCCSAGRSRETQEIGTPT